ncbi:uncharacterized protein LOC135474904 isoform X2 [Liolophura sinensis]|uniref:uncharacterized protein LOC135474904 isoform X2 n=1 Tax=Liolophura sinensis TaxID=3198878 RepID=UPI0031597C96
MAASNSTKVKCKFWEKCYRKDPAHKKEFLHPGDLSAGTSKLSGITLKGKTVVFTGILSQGTRKQATVRAKGFGLVVKPTVTKTTDIVVAGEMPGKKLDLADDNGVAVLTEEEWEQLLLQSASGPGKTGKQGHLIPSSTQTEGKPSPSKKQKVVSHEVSESEGSITDVNSSDDENGTRKTPLRRQRTHNLSDSEDESPGPAMKFKNATPTLPNEGKTTPRSPNKGNATAPSLNKGKAPRCKYWPNCYRNDPTHLKTFHHPPVIQDADPGEGTSAGGGQGDADYDDDDDEPAHIMDVGETVDVGNYRIKRVTDHYYCTCMGWKTQPGPVNKRTCKHLRQHLGEKFEAKRCGNTGVTKRQSPQVSKSPIKTPQLLLAQKFDEKIDPAGWWMSEKLDGVRAYWNGKGFYSRLGNPFYAPSWFTKGLPADMTLDGELFGGRGKFQSTVSIVKTADSPEWKKLTYQVFDVPCSGSLPFEKRMEKVKKYFDENSAPSVIVVTQTKCKGGTNLQGELERIIALGGEGVMIRQPGSQYEHRRSHTLLKYKKFYDAEARVIGHETGKGRNAGRCGALRCEMACGKKFSCGSGLSDQDRNKPPKIGSIITYKFQEYTNDGIPRFPTYLGVRIDLNQPSDADVPSKPDD